ncbi:hypothetical protein B0H67DRAFT_485871 [Lasiosphaeris hirsuta]|uniref:CorA-like transporter domain-containing protein n=1 Tax=Lasiosphaeris hirsuta TaxID=260670 RepID=A0AA40DZC9_9PEZI|nr:hypothetical protein B0H67DRAFT_485871 [Lasiosphaeris hirsuta]
MALLDNCFVESLTEPVRLIDVLRPGPGARQLQFSTLPELSSHLEAAQSSSYKCRFISICQRNSWRPLQITRPMLDLIVSSHGIDPSFWEIPSCFYTRNLDLEEVSCIPYTEMRTGDVIEISYTVKYPEYKASEDRWVIRQSGIWHRYDGHTGQSTFVLFSPTPDSKGHQQATRWLLDHTRPETEPFWLHRILFSAYSPAWRLYLAHLERSFLPIANTTFATFIEEPLRIGYDNLSALIALETRFLQIPTILATTSATLDDLSSFLASLSPTADRHTGTLTLRNLRRQSRAHARTAAHMQERARMTARLLANTLSFRDQIVATEQNGNMLQLNKSAVFITMLTLLYLPGSFVAALFGMNFFDYDAEDGGRIVGTSMVWIYVVAAVLLTALTVLFYYWLVQRDGVVFRRLAPKIRVSPDLSLKELTRHMLLKEKDDPVDMLPSGV